MTETQERDKNFLLFLYNDLMLLTDPHEEAQRWAAPRVRVLPLRLHPEGQPQDAHQALSPGNRIKTGCFIGFLSPISVLRIRILWVLLSLDLPDPLVRGMDPVPDPDHYIIKQK